MIHLFFLLYTSGAQRKYCSISQLWLDLPISLGDLDVCPSHSHWCYYCMLVTIADGFSDEEEEGEEKKRWRKEEDDTTQGV
jgi:hypothetical protein